MAVGSRRGETAEWFAREHGIATAHSRYEDLAADPDVDVVYIASLQPGHAGDAVMFLEAGDRFLMEAMWIRFNPGPIEAVRRIHEGEIGTVTRLDIDLTIAVDDDPEHRLRSLTMAAPFHAASEITITDSDGTLREQVTPEPGSLHHQVAAVNRALRAGERQCVEHPWHRSREVLGLCDRIRGRLGVRYPGGVDDCSVGSGMIVAVTTPTNDACVLMGTVALEPQRWVRGVADAQLSPMSPWFGPLAAAGFDGIELWERHAVSAPEREQQALIDHALPIAVLNSYVSLDDPDPSARAGVADWANRLGSSGIKFNVGNDADAVGAYGERIAAWIDVLPVGCRVLCECHHGISIAEDPVVAARIMAAAGPADRVQAIVHTHEDVDHIRERFDAYGDRITHIHVNHIDFVNMTIPRLAEVADGLAAKVDLLRELGFDGSWTIEFVTGPGTDGDRPAQLVDQAVADLAVLRSVLS